MKGRTGWTRAATAQPQVARELEHGGRGVLQRSFDGLRSVFQRHHQPGRVLVAVAAVAIAILLGALLVSYGSKLYQNWRENGLLDRATALLEQGELSKAAQMARELLMRYPDSLPALSILLQLNTSLLAGAPSPSGKAEVCKTSIPGSNPGGASKFI